MEHIAALATVAPLLYAAYQTHRVNTPRSAPSDPDPRATAEDRVHWLKFWCLLGGAQTAGALVGRQAQFRAAALAWLLLPKQGRVATALAWDAAVAPAFSTLDASLARHSRTAWTAFSRVVRALHAAAVDAAVGGAELDELGRVQAGLQAGLLAVQAERRRRRSASLGRFAESLALAPAPEAASPPPPPPPPRAPLDRRIVCIAEEEEEVEEEGGEAEPAGAVAAASPQSLGEAGFLPALAGVDVNTGVAAGARRFDSPGGVTLRRRHAKKKPVEDEAWGEGDEDDWDSFLKGVDAATGSSGGGSSSMVSSNRRKTMMGRQQQFR